MMESLANLVLYPPADNPGRPYTGYILMYPGSSFERLETVLQVDRIYDDGSLQIAYGDAVPYAVLLAAQA